MEPEQLELKAGMTVEVISTGNEAIFTGKVAEYADGTVTIRDSRGRDLPVGVYGTEVKLRFEQGDNNLMVSGKICRSSPDDWKLDQLEKQFTAPRRALFRQRVEVSAEVTCFRKGPEAPELKRGSGWIACKLTNVSAGGLQLQSGAPFQEGDVLSVRKAKLVDRGREFSFFCQVRRSMTGKDGMTLCGCKLEPLPSKEQAQLEEAIFQLQREEIQRKRER